MPFRCLDAQYRRELVRVYLSNVETICRKFVEERRAGLARLRDTHTGLPAFWQSLGTQQRQARASEHGDSLLKVRPQPSRLGSVCLCIMQSRLLAFWQSLGTQQRQALASEHGASLLKVRCHRRGVALAPRLSAYAWCSLAACSCLPA